MIESRLDRGKTLGSVVAMEEVHRGMDENREQEGEAGQSEEMRAQGELVEVDKGSAVAAEIDELGLGMQLLQLDVKKDESVPFRVYQRRQRTPKEAGGNLVCTFTTQLNFLPCLHL